MSLLQLLIIFKNETIANCPVSLVHERYLFTSCGKNKSLVDQLKTKAVPNKLNFIIAKMVDKSHFFNINNRY